MIDILYAENIAKKLQSKRPDFILCGSTALILARKIKRRNVHDLDFVCMGEYDHATLLGNYPPVEYIRYKCFRVNQDKILKNFYYNVFVHEDKNEIKTCVINGINCQDIDQILDWKKKFNREKDRIDLGLQQESQDIPF